MIQVAQIIFILSVLVILHEFGHYIAAKIFKVRVEKFYLFMDAGFSLVKKKIGDTEWGIGWLPIGGYVKLSGMIDESMDTEQMKQPAQPWEFRSKPAWQRLIIMLGGIFVNIVLALVIYTTMFSTVGQKYISTNVVQKNGLAFGEVGKSVGFKNGDKIISVDGEPIQQNFNRLIIDVLLSDKIEIVRNDKKQFITLSDEQKGLILGSEGKNFTGPRYTNAVVDSILPKSEAQKAGLQKGDKIIGINDKKFNYYDEFTEELKIVKKPVQLNVIRANQEIKLKANVNKEGKLGFHKPKRTSGSLPLNDREAHVHQPLRHLAPLGPIDQVARSEATDVHTVDVHRAQRGRHVGRKRHVAKPHDRQPVGHGDAAHPRLGQHAQGQQVGAAEHRVHIGRLRQQLAQRLAPAQQGARSAHIHHRHRPETGAHHRVGEGAGAAVGALVFGADQGQPAPALAHEKTRHLAADVGVREAHQHVDRCGREVPGFHHRNARGHEARAAQARVQDAGEENAVGPPADDGFEQRLFAARRVARLAQHELVTRVEQRVVERLDGRHEDRHHRARHHRRNQPAARRGQAAGHAVGHVAGLLHRHRAPSAARPPTPARAC